MSSSSDKSPQKNNRCPGTRFMFRKKCCMYTGSLCQKHYDKV